MFVALTLQPGPSGLLTRARDRMTGRDLIVQRKTFLGNHYYHLEARGKQIPWDRIARTTGRMSARMVTSPELEVPRSGGLGRFVPTIFEGRLTAVAAAQVLRNSAHPGSGFTVGLVDEDGLWSWCCRELAPLCGAVRVYTRRPER